MAEILESINSIASNFTVAEAVSLIKPLLLFIIGVSIYSIFIFKFYRFVAKREIFKFNLKKYNHSDFRKIKKFSHLLLYILKYLIIFPILTFFWFIVLSIILAFLSRNNTMQTVLLISFSLVAVIRIMAYYNEDLSKDLAKMLPFALLGVFLVDISYFSAGASLDSIKQLPDLWKIAVYYLIFIIILELSLRILFGIFRLFKSKED